jgi:hypothetical protein
MHQIDAVHLRQPQVSYQQITSFSIQLPETFLRAAKTTDSQTILFKDFLDHSTYFRFIVCEEDMVAIAVIR